HTVETYPDADVPADDVGHGERALGDRAERVPFRDVFEITRLGPADPLAAVERLDLLDRFPAVRSERERLRPGALARLLALRPDHQLVLPGEQRTSVFAEHLCGPLVDGPTRELAPLVADADERVAAADAAARVERGPPLAEAAAVE